MAPITDLLGKPARYGKQTITVHNLGTLDFKTPIALVQLNADNGVQESWVLVSDLKPIDAPAEDPGPSGKTEDEKKNGSAAPDAQQDPPSDQAKDPAVGKLPETENDQPAGNS